MPKRSLFAVAFALLTSSAFAQDCVVMLHGLARTEASFALMEEVLASAGFKVVNEGYPSRTEPIDTLASHVSVSVASCGEGARVHFVTHSMGGILLRAWAQRNPVETLGRSVMLAPPNRGSELVDKFGNLDFFESFGGPAGIELGTGPDSVPNRLGPANFEVGIIAGSRSFNPLLSAVFDGPNGGKVSVESTKLEGMRDHIVLATSHPLMMNNPVVIAQVLSFLRDGRFDHGLTLQELFRRATRKQASLKN